MRGIPIDKKAKPRRAGIVIFLADLRRSVLRLETWLADCSERAKQRRALASLTDHALRDIGLTRVDIEAEIDKPGWRP
ncbi:MAG TPA: DUF1127 domain-containing protein [Dongiaceae bacterium]|jgi:uncharacterized protein YjiS (DUF1127 family)